MISKLEMFLRFYFILENNNNEKKKKQQQQKVGLMETLSFSIRSKQQQNYSQLMAKRLYYSIFIVYENKNYTLNSK